MSLGKDNFPNHCWDDKTSTQQVQGAAKSTEGAGEPGWRSGFCPRRKNCWREKDYVLPLREDVIGRNYKYQEWRKGYRTSQFSPRKGTFFSADDGCALIQSPCLGAKYEEDGRKGCGALLNKWHLFIDSCPSYANTLYPKILEENIRKQKVCLRGHTPTPDQQQWTSPENWVTSSQCGSTKEEWRALSPSRFSRKSGGWAITLQGGWTRGSSSVINMIAGKYFIEDTEQWLFMSHETAMARGKKEVSNFSFILCILW